MSTDYDCWHEGDDVTVEQVIATVKANVALAQNIIRYAIPNWNLWASSTKGLLASAFITDKARFLLNGLKPSNQL